MDTVRAASSATTNDSEPDLEDLKYFRTGYQDLGRKSDFLLKDFLRELPGDGQLPKHWHYRSLEHFQKKYGNLGMIVWAASTNSHLLIINGHRVLRIWTDVDNSCWVDVNTQIASRQVVIPIPKGNYKKSAPFTYRIQISQRHQVASLVKAVKDIYGLDSQRLPVHKF